jgi:hypothetical protein
MSHRKQYGFDVWLDVLLVREIRTQTRSAVVQLQSVIMTFLNLKNMQLGQSCSSS